LHVPSILIQVLEAPMTAPAGARTCQYRDVVATQVNGDPPQPLAGLLVVDLTEWVAGPYCTKLLADFGARVIKIERSDGDPARRMGPYPHDEADWERSGLFLHLNTNKESVVVDCSKPAGAALVRSLIARADVVVESFTPGKMADWGLEPADLIGDRPELVVTSVTPFGQTGPYRKWEMTEIVAFAMGGMSASGMADREPVKLVGNVVLMQSGATACAATLAAVFHARERGAGQHVDVATFETQNGSLDRRRYYLLSYEYSGTVAERSAVVGAGRPAAGGRFECSDGKMITTSRVWPDHVGRMVGVLGDLELSALWDELGLDVMQQHPELINRLLGRWAAGRSSREAMREAQRAGWPVVVVNDPLLLLDDDHLVARGFWVNAPHPVAGPLVYTGAPWRIAGGGWALRHTAPTLGQHTDAILRELLGLDTAEIEGLRRAEVVA
jgi:crotonobetainyl-CoA:carnitine CoA-transferase CaiB-like acyl-CoA transferase